MADGARASRQVRRAQARRKEPVPKPFRLDRLAIPLLLAAGFFAYHNALHGPFVLDDIRAISQNETIRTLRPPWGVFSPPVHSPVTGRPLVNLSLAVNYAIGGESVTSYHLLNLAIHLLAALALFGIIRRTLRDRVPRYREQATGLATAAALLWVVHPLMTESVDYTIQRTELLMGLFFLLTLYCAIRGFGPPERRSWYGAALAAFVLGLGSKEVIVVAPAIVLVYDWLFDSASLRDALRRHWRLYAGYGAVLGLYVLFVGSRLRRAFTGLSGRAVAPWDYALTQSAVIVHYLRLALWPHPLAADYDGWPIATSPRSVLPYLAVVLAIVALTLWGLARRRKLAFLGAWFLFILAPTSSVRPIATEVAAERRMYLPLAALVVLAVLGGWELLRRWEAPRAARFAAVAALALTLALVTVRRNDDYRTVLGFWSDAVAKRPDSPRARLWLGYYLYKQGRNAEALRHETEAVRLQPENGEAQYSLGVVLTKFDRMDDAIHRFRQAIRINPRYVEAHYNLAIALSRQGRKEQAAEHLETAIRLQPDFSPARNALSNIRGGAIR
jgi:tetratricopeptide (TPR) repeat protein